MAGRALGGLRGHGRVRAASVLAEETRILAFKPDVGNGIHSFDVRARTPDGATHILLLVKDVLREWPTPYILSTPFPLPAGTTLVATAYFRASAASAAAPSFEVTVSRDTATGCVSPIR